MQVHTFNIPATHPHCGGGFCAHKIFGNCSAWYDAAGYLVDAERFDRLGRAYPVRSGTPLWRKLQEVSTLVQRLTDINNRLAELKAKKPGSTVL